MKQHQKDGWQVYSEKGKHMGGPYKSETQANKRLQQMEFFKKHAECKLKDLLPPKDVRDMGIGAVLGGGAGLGITLSGRFRGPVIPGYPAFNLAVPVGLAAIGAGAASIYHDIKEKNIGPAAVGAVGGIVIEQGIMDAFKSLGQTPTVAQRIGAVGIGATTSSAIVRAIRHINNIFDK